MLGAGWPEYKIHWWGAKGNDKGLHTSTCQHEIQKCKTFTWTEIWQSTQNHRSLQKGNQNIAKTQTSWWCYLSKSPQFPYQMWKCNLWQTWNALDTSEVLCLVLSKLPGHTRKRWNRTVMSTWRKYSREPDFADLIQFVEDVATLVNDPLFKESIKWACWQKRGSSKKKTTKDISHKCKWKYIQIFKFLSIVSKG